MTTVTPARARRVRPADAMYWISARLQRRGADLRTNLWLVPTVEMFAAVALFVGTGVVDRDIYRDHAQLPSWLINGSADSARQILISIAGAVITVVGIVFSITIVTLTLASSQFGTRMLRNFIRDRGTQLTLGTFVATFVYCILVLVSVGPGDHGDYVPQISVTLTFVVLLIDLGVLIYFIHHIATQIQPPQLIAGIARDLARAIQHGTDGPGTGVPRSPDQPSLDELTAALGDSGAVIPAPHSGYIQFAPRGRLVRLAADAGAVLRLPYRPGHFLVEGEELVIVWPPEAADHIARNLKRVQITGPHRALEHDVSFGVDQLVEIAVRALSPAVNDTFTAITCVDWLGENLCNLARVWAPSQVHRDRSGAIRVISDQVSFAALVEWAFDKIRHASLGIPAVMIRQLEALTTIMGHTTDALQAGAVLDQATMISQSTSEIRIEESARARIQRRYTALVDVYSRLGLEPPSGA